MVYNINDSIRRQIFENKTVAYSVNYIGDLTENNKESILRLLLSDFFKINVSNLEIMDTRQNLEIFKYTIDDLIITCLNDINFLVQILKGAFEFYNSTLITKSIIIEEMEAHDFDDKLMEISKLHILDKISYTFSYDLEDFKIYFLDYIKKHRTFGEKDSLANEFLTDKMIFLRSIDFEKYKSYLLEFIRQYYKWNLFRKEKLKIVSRFEGDYEYLCRVKNESLESLINHSMNDYDFLLTLLVNYLYYTIFSNNEMAQSAEKYLLKNSDEGLQKKLQLKRD